MNVEQGNVEIGRSLAVLRRRAPWILLCVVIAAGAAYGYSKHKTKEYTATALLSFSNNAVIEQIAGLSAGGAVTAATQQASDIELVGLGDTAAKTAKLLGHGLTGAAVRASLGLSARGETTIVDVSATSASPVLAAAIANTYVSQFAKEQQGSNHQFFKSALALVNKQLASLSPAQRFGADGLDLENRAHTLGLLAELGYNNARVTQEALVPSGPSSPKTKKNTILGAVAGLLLGLGVALLLERLDRRIREPEELEAIYSLPMLGVVPKSAALARSKRHDGGGGAAVPPAEAEAFSLIRAHLRFLNTDRDLCTVLIASPAPEDGKTTIALHLAEAAARSGSRVLLLEADLRHPTLARQLDIQPGPGLADVLIGAISMDEATRSVALQAPFGDGAKQRTLDVLTAGAVPPPNPGELLESHATDSLLAQAKAVYDLVVIDTPPLTAVSDAFPLLTKVDGVVIVGRPGHSRRDAAERVHQILASSGAPLLGIIANGSKSGVPVPYPGDGKSSPAVALSNDAPSPEELVPTTKA